MPPKLTLEQLTTPLSPAEVQASIYKVLGKLGVRTTGWLSGSVVRAIVTSSSVVIASLSELQAYIAKSGFLELAEGPWLTIVAKYVYGVERIEATYATGEVTLTNDAGGVFSLEAGDLILRNSAEDKTYVNTEAFTLGANTSIKIKVRAQELGTDSNADPGQIDELVTPLTGVKCSNANPVVALDEESDEQLRTRCYEKPSAISPNGAREAYSYLAKSATREDGSSIGVTRVKVSRSSDKGQVQVIIAGPSGPIDSNDLGRVETLLLENVVPQGVTLTLENAAEKNVDVECEVWVYSSISMSDEDIEATIKSALNNYLSKLPIGGIELAPQQGFIFRDALIEVIRRAIPGEIARVVLATPTDDLTILENEIAKGGTITVSISRISR